jgi:hypothetical protein
MQLENQILVSYHMYSPPQTNGKARLQQVATQCAFSVLVDDVADAKWLPISMDKLRRGRRPNILLFRCW